MNVVGLSGNLWPIHLKPLPGELLSSWLVRLAHGHGLKLQTFCAMVFGRDKPIWGRDIDKLAPEWLITKLAECTGTSAQVVFGTTLKSYEGVLYERHQPNGNTKWILPVGVYHRTRRRHGLQYCPYCLKEDDTPYFRKHWRLALSTVCTRHQCLLLDGCPKCASPLVPHRTDMQGRQYFPHETMHVHCWKCGFDLRLAKAGKVKNKALVRLQVQLESVIENGYTDWAGNPTMHSLVFFEGVRALIAGMTSRHTKERLRKSATLDRINLDDWSRTRFEMMPITERRGIVDLLTLVLKKWPTNFTELIKDCRLRYCDLKGDSEQRVFWYENVIQEEAGCGYAPISKEEARAIANVVEVKHGRFSGATARRLYGHDINGRVPEYFPQPVTDDVYEELLTSIDHQVAGTLDRIERACLIRDKVMFATGRQLRLSERALAELTLDRVRVLVPEKVALDFFSVAKSPVQARAWVEWYWDRMRPQLQPEPSADHVFTSARTKCRFRRSAIGVKFHRLVEAAMLRRSIRNYGCWANSNA